MREFVTCDLIGRLGNQAFQLFTTISVAKKYGIDWYAPEETMSPKDWEFYFKDLNLPTISKQNELEHCKELYREAQDFTFEPIKYNGKSLKLHGYFQSELYFKEYRKEIMEVFSPLYEGDMYKGTVSVHVRRGDYLQYSDKFPPTKTEYLKRAIDYFSDNGHKDFMVFSDDIDWCFTYFNEKHFGDDITFSFAMSNLPIADFKMMMRCEHNIITNSSFSWTAAWLNKNENKIVVSPKTEAWFGKGNAHLKTENIIPKEWTQL